MSLAFVTVGVAASHVAPAIVVVRQAASASAWHNNKKQLAFVKGSSRPRVELHSNRRDFDGNDVVLDVVEQVTSTLSSPTPFLNIPLGYPLALLTATALFPWSTSVLLTLFFGGYLYLGKTFTEDDDDDNVADLAALVGAIASAGLLSPQGFDGSTDHIFRAIGTAGIGLAAATVLQSSEDEDGDSGIPPESSADEQLMNIWDEKFEAQSEKRDE